MSAVFEKPGKKVYIIKAKTFVNDKGHLSHASPGNNVNFREDHEPLNSPKNERDVNYAEDTYMSEDESELRKP